MLEVKIAAMETRNGHNYKAGEDLYQGCLGYVSGVDSNGYTLIKAPATSTQAALAVYPFKKYHYVEDGSDTAAAYEKINSGDSLIVFEGGGEFVTDKIVHTGLVHTAEQRYMWDSAMTVTDSAAYTLGGGYVRSLYVSVGSGTKGYLAGNATAAGWPAYAGTGLEAAWNKNIVLTRAYAGTYGPYTHVSFRIPPNALPLRGMYIDSAGASAVPTLSPYYYA